MLAWREAARADAVFFLEIMDYCSVGMIQRRENSRFTLETRNAVVVVAEGFGKELDGDTAAQPRVGGLIHVSHAARSQVARDLVVCELGANHVVMKICGRILSNNRKSLTYLKLGAGKS